MRSTATAALIVLFFPVSILGAQSQPAPGATTIDAVRVSAGLSSATITWQAREGRGIAGWIVSWSGHSALTRTTGGASVRLKPGARKCVLRGLEPGRVYTVRAYPYYKQKGRVARASVSGEPLPLKVRVGKRGNGAPAALKGLTAIADGSRVRLSWQPSQELNVIGYEIARSGPADVKPKPYLKLFINELRPRLTAANVAAAPGAPTGARRASRPRRGSAPPAAAAVRGTPAGASAIIDAGLEQGKEYAYSVRAFTADPEPLYSAPAKPVTVKTAPYVFRPGDLLLVVNTSSKNGRKIASNYCWARGIKKPSVLKVRLPVKADISRAAYNKLVLAPVRRYLRQHPRTTMILLVRGMPLRIQRTAAASNGLQTDAASVGSELALARADAYGLTGKVRNPLYGKAARLTPVDGILGVCRLDGPDDRTANDLVKRAIAGEKRGIEGIAFFDARGLQKGSYASGDRMIRKAAKLMKEDGRLTVRLDDKGPVIDLSLMKEKIGFYYGWYRGSFIPKNKSFRFGRGALAAHLHSSSAAGIAQDRYWVGPLVYHGAAATFGTVYEPYLDGFPAADGFVDALLKGRNFAEAALSANRYLSWMATHIGDPLYQPFKPKKKADNTEDAARQAPRK